MSQKESQAWLEDDAGLSRFIIGCTVVALLVSWVLNAHTARKAHQDAAAAAEPAMVVTVNDR